MRSVLLLVALSGCLWGHCGPTVTEVTWHSTDMFHAIGGETVMPTGFDIGEQHVLAARVLREQGHADTVGLGVDGLDAHATGHDGIQEAGRLARSILENVTDLDSGAIDSTIDAFIASAEAVGEVYDGEVTLPFYRLVAAVDAEVDLGPLLSRHPALGWEHADPQGYGAYAWDGDWAIDYDAATRTWTDGTVSIRADALGHVQAEGPWRENESEEAVLADLRQRIDGAGLPEPAEMEPAVIVC